MIYYKKERVDFSMNKVKTFKKIFKEIPLSIKLPIIAMWIPMVNLFTFIPYSFRIGIMLSLLFIEYLIIRPVLNDFKNENK